MRTRLPYRRTRLALPAAVALALLAAGPSSGPTGFRQSVSTRSAHAADGYTVVATWNVEDTAAQPDAPCPPALPAVVRVGAMTFDAAGRLLVDVSCAAVGGRRAESRLAVIDPAAGAVASVTLDIPAGSPLAFDPYTSRVICTNPQALLALPFGAGAAAPGRWEHRQSVSGSNVPRDIAVGPFGVAYTYALGGVGRYGPDTDRYATWTATLEPGRTAQPGSLHVDGAGRVHVTAANAPGQVFRFSSGGRLDAAWGLAQPCPAAGPIAGFPGGPAAYVLCGDGAGSPLAVVRFEEDGAAGAAFDLSLAMLPAPRPALAAGPDGGFAVRGRVRGAVDAIQLFGPDGTLRMDVQWSTTATTVPAAEPQVSVGMADRVLASGRRGLALYDAHGARRHAWPLPAGTRERVLAPDGAVFLLREATGYQAFLERYDESGFLTWSVQLEQGANSGLAVGERFAFVGSTWRGVVAVLDADDGTPVGWLQSSAGADPFVPRAAAVGPDERLYALDDDLQLLQVWDLGLAVLRPVQQIPVGEARDQVRPLTFAVSPEGRVALVEEESGGAAAGRRLRVLEPSGATVWSADAGSGPLAGRRVHDVAFDGGGRLVVLSGSSSAAPGADGPLAVTLLAPTGPRQTPTAAPTATPLATPPAANTGVCTVGGDKWAEPVEIWLGEQVTVTLTLGQTCPEATDPADVVLVVDTSGSMRGAKARAMGSAVRAFADQLDPGRHRLGVVTFNTTAALHTRLTASGAAFAALPEEFGANGGTNISAGLERAVDHLRRDGRADAKHVVVFFTDGQWNYGGDPLPLAKAARAEGVMIFAVGTADADMALLTRMAGAVERAFHAPSEDELPALYGMIAAIIGSDAGGVALEDIAGRDVMLVAGTASVRPFWASSTNLRWSWPAFVVAPMTITYRVEPLRTGWVPTNEAAWFDYVDADGAVRRFTYPVPRVLVRAPWTATPSPSPTPSATPSPTTTATPSPTPRPARLYLPLGLREARCLPETQRMDALLVIDTSTSMLDLTASGRLKLDAAVEAAALFSDRLALGAGDQAGIVYFNREAHLARQLTGDRAALQRALARPEVNLQTCLVCGVEAALAELTSSRRLAPNIPVMIVLTDGLSNPRPASEAVEAARRAKQAGIVVFTVGLGTELDLEALAEMASRPRYFYHTEDAEQLARIYAEIAVEIPCPGDGYWGSRG